MVTQITLQSPCVYDFQPDISAVVQNCLQKLRNCLWRYSHIHSIREGVPHTFLLTIGKFSTM